MATSENQAGWRVDVNQCISCRACEMACKVEYGLQAGQGRRRRVIERTDVSDGVVRTYFVSVSCHHCQFPACKAACPKSVKLESDGGVAIGDDPYTSALYKDKTGNYTSTTVAGVVLHNPAVCIGCRRCEWACPYGAPQFNVVTRKMHKCELCWQRIANTSLSLERRRPACEATCLGGSIIFAPAGVGTSDPRDWNPASAYSSHGNWDDYGSGQGNYLGLGTDLSIDVTAKDGTEWARPGSSPTGAGYSAGRGSAESASYLLTYPAIRFRTRVYLEKDGSAVDAV